MSNDFVKKINEHNLCTYYVLPLIGLNSFDFQKANFINSYITREGKMIVVEVADANLCNGVMQNQHFIERKQTEYSELLIFQIPREWNFDVMRYMKGEYSHLTFFAKKLIREGSGLNYNKKDEEGKMRTDARLMALEKHPALKEHWAEELGVDVRDLENTELLSPPSEKSYIDIDQP